MLQYEKRGIRRDLLDVILDKKLKLILKAETANEVKRASEPPKPVYNYGTWREDPGFRLTYLVRRMTDGGVP